MPEIVNPLFNICYFHGSVYSHGGVLDYDTLSQCSKWIPVSSIQYNHLSFRLGKLAGFVDLGGKEMSCKR